MELAIEVEPEQPEEGHVVGDDDRHRRRLEIGAVIADHEIDLVDVEELGDDPRHRRRVALVVVVNKFDRPAQEPTFGVGLVFPDLHR
jgi:hypothetical protein